MRVFITGASGFVGQHLAQHLRESYPKLELHGSTLNLKECEQIREVDQWHEIDLRNETQVSDLIQTIQPAQIYHLAGQAFVPRSFEAPWETLENNIRSQLNLFLACIQHHPTARILIAGSAEIYGKVDRVPIDETAPLQPSSPYSVSKVTQDLLGLQYHLSHGLHVLRARSFNHFGPKQSDRFAVPAFAIQIARIEAGQQDPVLRVGDLSAQRDFTDVRDIVRAYRLLLEHGAPGEAYNIASGVAHSIQKVLDTLLQFTSVPITIRIDEARLRPSNIPILVGDNTRLRQATGWFPTVRFEQTLQEVLEDCRQRVRQQIGEN